MTVPEIWYIHELYLMCILHLTSKQVLTNFVLSLNFPMTRQLAKLKYITWLFFGEMKYRQEYLHFMICTLL